MNFDDLPEPKVKKTKVRTPGDVQAEKRKKKKKKSKEKEIERVKVKKTKEKEKAIAKAEKKLPINSKKGAADYALAVKEKGPQNKIAPLGKKQIKSIFGRQTDSLLELLESGDFDTPKMQSYKLALQMVLDIMPLVEHNFRNSKGTRGFYQLQGLINSMRELWTDVQSMQDRGRVGELIIEKIIQPTMLDFANVIISSFQNVSSDAQLRMKGTEYELYKLEIDKAKKEMASEFQKMFFGMRDKIRDYMKG